MDHKLQLLKPLNKRDLYASSRIFQKVLEDWASALDQHYTVAMMHHARKIAHEINRATFSSSCTLAEI
jgi:hypothetical protein